MKRNFDLGISVEQVHGFRRRLSITVEFGGLLYRKEDEGYFCISGKIGGGNRWVSTGQCQEQIREICHKKWYALLDELLEFDKKYWLRYCKCIPKKDADRIIEIINS